MTLRYEVHRGDSLWHISFRHLKDGMRWREIFAYHNSAVKNLVQFKDFLPIVDENLIYIGQTLLLPLRPNAPSPIIGNGTVNRNEASRPATGVNLRVVYDIEEHNNPTHYQLKMPDYTIDSKFTGKITIEHLGEDRYKHNVDLIVNKNNSMIEHNLSTFAHKAFKDLTQNVKMTFDPKNSEVIISAPITTMANIGSTTVTVQAVSPTSLVGQAKPKPISTTVEIDRRKYNYTADIEFKVEVTLHPNRRIKDGSTIDFGFPQKTSRDITLEPTTTNSFIVAVSLLIMGVLAWQVRASGLAMKYSMPHHGSGLPAILFIKNKTFTPDA